MHSGIHLFLGGGGTSCSRQAVIVCCALALGLVPLSAGTANAETSPPMFMQIVPLRGYQYCRPNGISGDGTTVVGAISTPIGFVGQPFRWTAKEGMVGLGWLPGHDKGTANAISHDGSVIVGSSGQTGAFFAFRWTKKDGMQPLPSLPGATMTRAKGVSGDGVVIVATAEPMQTARWVSVGLKRRELLRLGRFRRIPHSGVRRTPSLQMDW